jgi:hypothetical protein
MHDHVPNDPTPIGAQINQPVVAPKTSMSKKKNPLPIWEAGLSV